MSERRCILIMIMALLECGAVATSSPATARAAAGSRISAISVAVSGGIASYTMCVVIVAPPKGGTVTLGGSVTVDGPKGQAQASLQYAGQACGTDSYLVAGAFRPLPAGAYRFRAACALAFVGSKAASIPCLVRDGGLIGNTSGATVATQCQVDFTTSQALVPRDCNGPGASGTLAGTSVAPGVPPPGTQPTLPGRAGPTATPPRGTVSVPWFGPPASRAYFAEGFTGAGYQEYLSLLNPSRHPLDAQVTLYRVDGATRTVSVRLAPLTRRTLDVNTIAPGTSTALRVMADGALVAERGLYVPDGSGHIVAGAAAPSRRWYVAGARVGRGAADALRIFNPSEVPAFVTIASYRDGRTVHSSHRLIGSGMRLNVALEDVAPSGATSLALDSTAPIVVESIVREHGVSGVSDAFAVPDPSRTWYMPGGDAPRDVQEYAAIFNPTSGNVMVRVLSVGQAGKGARVSVRLKAHARAVVALGGGSRGEPPAIVTASRPVVAQAISYTRAGGVALVDGVPRAARAWGLAEGYQGTAFEERITLLDPSLQGARVTIRLIGRQGTARIVSVYLPPRHRVEVPVHGLLPNGPVAALFNADRPIVVGRTLIFNHDASRSTTAGVIIPGS